MKWKYTFIHLVYYLDSCHRSTRLPGENCIFVYGTAYIRVWTGPSGCMRDMHDVCHPVACASVHEGAAIRLLRLLLDCYTVVPCYSHAESRGQIESACTRQSVAKTTSAV
jgi:hypothetical protein